MDRADGTLHAGGVERRLLRASRYASRASRAALRAFGRRRLRVDLLPVAATSLRPADSEDSRRERTAAKQLRRKLGDNADSPTYILNEPSVGYRMAKAETQEQEEA